MKVLIPIENKPTSQAQIDALLGMQWRPGTEIMLVSVVPSAAEHLRPDGSPTKLVDELESIVIELQKVLRHCTLSLFIREGDPKTELVALALEARVDMIICGSNCKRTLERMLLGSVSQALLNDAHCPTFIVRPTCHTITDAQTGFKNVLLPMDDSPYSEVVLRWLANWSWAPNTRFIMAAVVDDEFTCGLAEETLRQRSVELSNILQTNNIAIEIAHGDPKRVIPEMVKAFATDLVVIGSHGRTGVKKLLLGSVSEYVAQHAPCSVVVVKDILPKDHSWQRTGAFHKLHLPSAAEWMASAAPSYPSGNESPPHVVPGGMG